MHAERKIIKKNHANERQTPEQQRAMNLALSAFGIEKIRSSRERGIKIGKHIIFFDGTNIRIK